MNFHREAFEQPGASVDPSEVLPTVVLPSDELPSELHDDGRVMSNAPITACKFARCNNFCERLPT